MRFNVIPYHQLSSNKPSTQTHSQERNNDILFVGSIVISAANEVIYCDKYGDQLDIVNKLGDKVTPMQRMNKNYSLERMISQTDGARLCLLHFSIAEKLFNGYC
eukprot:982404_1